MNTFLPYPSMSRSARVLDDKRLRNQANEALVILRTITGWYDHHDKKGWPHHPATKMWVGHDWSLYEYSSAIIREMSRRKMPTFTQGYHLEAICTFWMDQSNLSNPLWFGNEAFHSAHRAALLAKDPEWYGQWGWKEEPVINYMWPVGEKVI